MYKVIIVTIVMLMAVYTGIATWLISRQRLMSALAGLCMGLLCVYITASPAGMEASALIFCCIAVGLLLEIMHIDSIGYGDIAYIERSDGKKCSVVIRAGGPRFSEGVLDCFRENVGRFRAETGGMLASSSEKGEIDLYHFDSHSKNTAESFYYDVDSMTEVYQKWKENGAQPCGIVHSHPRGMSEPSYHDISTALIHIDFFGIKYFHMPIIQPGYHGRYTLYFYEVEKEDEIIIVKLCYVIKAEKDGSYNYVPFYPYEMRYPVTQLISYRKSIGKQEETVPQKRTDVVKEIEMGLLDRKRTEPENGGNVSLLLPPSS